MSRTALAITLLIGACILAMLTVAVVMVFYS